MTTSRNRLQHLKLLELPKKQSMKYQQGLPKRKRVLRVLLLLLSILLLLTISGCSSNLNSNPKVVKPKVTISSELMAEPKLTQELLNELSQ